MSIDRCRREIVAVVLAPPIEERIAVEWERFKKMRHPTKMMANGRNQWPKRWSELALWWGRPKSQRFSQRDEHEYAIVGFTKGICYGANATSLFAPEFLEEKTDSTLLEPRPKNWAVGESWENSQKDDSWDISVMELLIVVCRVLCLYVCAREIIDTMEKEFLDYLRDKILRLSQRKNP